MKIEHINIDTLNPADYNPRLLTDDAQENLKRSLTELGVIKPIIIRRSDNRIMAGHQRTKTMKLLGYTHVPAFVLDNVNSTDEVRFNQLHNIAECELSEVQPDIQVILPDGTKPGFQIIPSKEYGVFEYSHLDRKTYIQSFAQKMRLREKNGKLCGHTHSTLYEKLVIPFITKDMRILDFGAGQKDYAIFLKKRGYYIDAIEFFHRKDNIDAIDEKEIRRDCADICNTLATYGLYDVVVCDSVLNSVNSLDDEKNVLLSLSALCKPGGIIFWSGIPLAFALRTSDRKNTKDYRSKVVFLDKNNFTANYRFGEWYFQHYHNLEDVSRLNKAYIGESFKVYDKGILTKEGRDISGSSFQVMAINDRNPHHALYMEALRYEFSLPLPGNERWDLDKDILPVFETL